MTLRSLVAKFKRDVVLDPTFDDLWQCGVVNAPTFFDPAQLSELPGSAQRYLGHALSPGVRLATVVRLQMHGTIKLKGVWQPFEADQVIHRTVGFVWRAKVRTKYVTITGSDRWIDSEGSMRWNLFGVLPFIRARGADVSRSSLGRGQIESIWNPSTFIARDAHWTAPDGEHASVRLHIAEHPAHLDLDVDKVGQLRSVRATRWGNPGGGRTFREYAFGALATKERTFDGVTIPSELRVGWYFGSDKFETEGEFFRVTVDRAEFK